MSILPPRDPRYSGDHRRPSGTEEVRPIPLESIVVNQHQPRKTFDEAHLKDLAASIQAKGVIQPITVRPWGTRFQIVAGERRYRAAVAAGLTAIPALVRDLDERDALSVGLIENLQRQDLNPLEEALTFKRLIEEFGFTQESLAKEVGKNRTTISNTIRLLKLPEEVRTMVTEKKLSAGHARALLGAPERKQQIDFAVKCVEQGWSVRKIEKVIQELRKSRAPRAVPQKATYIAAMEEQLAEMLFTSVTIKERGKGGSLTINYNDLDEFDRLREVIEKGSGKAFEQVVRLKQPHVVGGQS